MKYWPGPMPSVTKLSSRPAGPGTSMNGYAWRSSVSMAETPGPTGCWAAFPNRRLTIAVTLTKRNNGRTLFIGYLPVLVRSKKRPNLTKEYYANLLCHKRRRSLHDNIIMPLAF